MWRWGFGLILLCGGLWGLAMIAGFERQVNGAFAVVGGEIENRLPDSVYVALNGEPLDKPAIDVKLASGAGLTRTYRDLWMESRFPDGRFTGDGVYHRVCAPAYDLGDCDFHSLAAALAEVGDGETLVLSPGIYREAAVIEQSRLTIIAEPGAHLQGETVGGKGALVIRGDNVTIEGLECSEIRVGDRNGACVRLEGRNLTLRGVNFHDSEQGVLSGSNRGLVTIEDSMFNRLGQGGQAHGIYIGGGAESALVVSRSHFLNIRNEGHGIKSRAASNIILDNVVASLDEEDSRAIDLPNGGKTFISGNIIQNGRNSSNQDAIGIGLERADPPEDPAAHRAVVTNNLFILDRSSNDIVHSRRVPEPEITGNFVVGRAIISQPAGNSYIRSRAMAGLPAAPDLLVRGDARR